MIRILDTKPLGDPLKLLSSHVSGRKMTLHMVEQARHLTKYVVTRCEGKEVSLGSVKVAPCPLDTCSIVAKGVAEQSERVQSITAGRLPGRFNVSINRLL